jgi:beta,beta-carotene 9',10'-dioxygenase
VLTEYPLVGDVQAIAARTRPFIENYEWRLERGTIFTVISKADGTVVARAQGEPFLGIHQIDCFERDGAIVFDVPAYPEGRHISNLYLDRRAAAEALETSQIKRYTVPLNGMDATGEILFDEFAELPTIRGPFNFWKTTPHKVVFGCASCPKTRRNWLRLPIVRFHPGSSCPQQLP